MVAFVFIISTQVLVMAPSLVVAEIDKEKLRDDLTSINVDIQEKLLSTEVSGGIEGIYDLEGNTLPTGVDTLPQENSILTAALYTRYVRSGNAEAEDWADGTFSAINNLKSNSKIARDKETGVYYTADQAMVLEFLSIGFKHSQNQKLTTLMETLYTSLNQFEANETAGYSGYENAFWRAIGADGNKYEPNNDYKFCYTNSSLWAIIGMLNFGQTMKGTVSDNEDDYSGTSVTWAKEIIEFCEDYCYFNGTGFLEYPYANMTTPEKNFYFNTQVLGVLAYTRLYEATEEQAYLDKANMLVEFIIPAFFLDTGKIGGCVSRISVATGFKSSTKKGYDNALYAYALLNLYEATNDPTYLQRAEEIAVFMKENLYVESEDGTLVGYKEILQNDEIQSDQRYWKTNALMLWVNEEVIWNERPWYVKYMWFLIIGAIIILAIIGIIILIRRRNRIFKKSAEFAEGILES